jgi:hypothetical protein
MSNLLTRFKFSFSKIYPKNSDLSAQSTFYVKAYFKQGQRFKSLKSKVIKTASSL